MENIKIERTGNTYSLSSCEFLATYPDGSTETFWSPPWHEMTEAEEEAKALEVATSDWKSRKKCYVDEEPNQETTCSPKT